MEQRNACRAIEMKLPAEKDMLLVVRLTASGILTRCGATLDVMDDFKIAVEEACSLLIAQTEPGENCICGSKWRRVGRALKPIARESAFPARIFASRRRPCAFWKRW